MRVTAQAQTAGDIENAARAQHKIFTAMGKYMAMLLHVSRTIQPNSPLLTMQTLSDFTEKTYGKRKVRGLNEYLHSRPEVGMLGGGIPVFLADGPTLDAMLHMLENSPVVYGRIPPITEKQGGSPCIVFCDQKLYADMGFPPVTIGDFLFPEVSIITLDKWVPEDDWMNDLAQGFVLAHELEHGVQMLTRSHSIDNPMYPDRGSAVVLPGGISDGGYVGDNVGDRSRVDTHTSSERTADIAAVGEYLKNHEKLSIKQAGRVIDAILQSDHFGTGLRELKTNSYLQTLYQQYGVAGIMRNIIGRPVAKENPGTTGLPEMAEYVERVRDGEFADILQAREPFTVGGSAIAIRASFYLPRLAPSQILAEGAQESLEAGPRADPTYFVTLAGKPAMIGLYEDPYGRVYWIRNDIALQGKESYALAGAWIKQLEKG